MDGRIKLHAEKTTLGGGLTILTVLTILIVLSTYLILVFVIYEESSISLVPAVDQSSSRPITLRANLTLAVGAGAPFLCSQCNLLTTTGFSTAETTCSQPQPDHCTILWSCPNCLFSPGARLHIETEANGWAVVMYWSMTSQSHAGDFTSAGHFNAEGGQFFRGKPYNRVNLLTVREQYHYRSDTPKEGVILQVETIQPGRQLNVTTFGRESGCGLDVEIGVNPALLQINVTIRESLLSIVAQVFSLVLGIISLSRFFLLRIQSLQKRPEALSLDLLDSSEIQA